LEGDPTVQDHGFMITNYLVVIPNNNMNPAKWSVESSYLHSIYYWIQEAKNFLQKKGFRDGLSYSTPQKNEETRRNVIAQPRSHPIKKM